MKPIKPRRRMLRNLVLIGLFILLLIATILGVGHFRVQKKLHSWIASPEYQTVREQLVSKNHIQEKEYSTIAQNDKQNLLPDDAIEMNFLAGDLIAKLPVNQERVNIQALRENTALMNEIEAYLSANTDVLHKIIATDLLSTFQIVFIENDNLYTAPKTPENATTFRELVLLISLKCTYETAIGNPEIAWQWLSHGIQQVSQRKEPLYGFMLTDACTITMIEHAESLLRQGFLPGKAHAEIDSALHAYADITRFQHTLKYEQIFLVELHRLEREKLTGILSIIKRPIGDYRLAQLMDAEQELMGVLMVNDVEERIQLYQTIKIQTKLPSRLNQMALTALVMTTRQREVDFIECELLRLGLAAAQYRAEYGNYPEEVGTIESLLTMPLANPGIYTAFVNDGGITLRTTLPDSLIKIDLPQLTLE